MKTKLFLSLLFCSTMATAQVTTEATVTQKINTFLPTNNVRGISASGLRSTLLTMTDLIARKVNNEQIIVSADGKSIKIKPAGTAAAFVPRKVELSVDFQNTLDVPTMFTYQTKDVFKRQIKVDVTSPTAVILTGIDHLVNLDGDYIYKDANNIVFHESIHQITTEQKMNYNVQAGTITANNFTCGSCTDRKSVV